MGRSGSSDSLRTAFFKMPPLPSSSSIGRSSRPSSARVEHDSEQPFSSSGGSRRRWRRHHAASTSGEARPMAGAASLVSTGVLARLVYTILLAALIGAAGTTSLYLLDHDVSWSPTLRRTLSINLGGGNCKWEAPKYEVSETEKYFKTLIAGFPSGDKRLTFVQMEALTGLPAKDEWDFENLGMSNHPFIKANYPHHEGIWGWGDAADQVVMVVRNMRRAMVEYHDVLWDIGYAKTWEDAFDKIPNLYAERPPMDDFLVWRDERVHDEIYWYGWFIDYYMEGGLMRDMFTHKITTPTHWNMLMQPTRFTRDELRYDKVVGNDTVVTPSYDPHCLNVTNGCKPAAIISAEKLVETENNAGAAVALKIAEVLQDKQGMNVIAEEARECIWKELIVNKKGLKTFVDRQGHGEEEYSFTGEHLQDMIFELNRLIEKYTGVSWIDDKIAQVLVSLITEHRNLIQAEYNLGGFRRMLKRKNPLDSFDDK